jgi:hypothetical protein
MGVVGRMAVEPVYPRSQIRAVAEHGFYFRLVRQRRPP